MSQLTNPTAARLLLALSVLPTALLVPAAATAATAPSTKAQVEHAEQQAATGTSKAQVEHAERTTSSRTTSTGTTTSTSRPPATGTSGGDDAAAWQLALSAALGAALTGGVVLASRQVTTHRRPLAS